MKTRPKAPVQLYKHFDIKGTLLYVGIAKNSGMRFAEHRRNSVWAPRSVKMTVEMYPDRLAASLAELDAIKSEKPLYNAAHLERPVLINKCPPALVRPRRKEQTVMVSARILLSVAEQVNLRCVRDDISKSQILERALIKFLKMA